MKFEDVVQENGHLVKTAREMINNNMISHVNGLIDNFEPKLNKQQLQALQSLLLKEVQDLFFNKIKNA